MKIELTEAQIEEIGMGWLRDKVTYQSADLVKLLFKELRYSKYEAWTDMLALAVKTCSKEFLVSPSDILTLVKDELNRNKKGTN